MSDTPHYAQEFCSDLVGKRDEDRWLAARYAPAGERRRLYALYAFQCELRHIPGAVSAPPLGEIRLQWWRDAFQEIRDGKPARAHPVVEEIAAAGLAAGPFSRRIEQAIDAAARPLYEEQFTDIADLAGWLERAEGVFDNLAVSLLGGDRVLSSAAVKAGAAFALAREGKGLAPNIAGGIDRHTLRMWRDAVIALKGAPLAVMPAVLHLSLTPAYLKRGKRPFPLVKRGRLFSAMAFGKF